jgi:CRISPR-associated protein Csm1
VSDSHVLVRLSQLARVWKGEAAAEAKWLSSGLAIEGDFAGIQNYVLKPVPGFKGAAKRLRARSYRVTQLTGQIAEDVLRKFIGPSHPSPFYVTGGRFLLCVPLEDGWERKVSEAQARLDLDLFQEFGGEVAFHLAAARYQGKVPAGVLFEQHRRRRSRPLENALCTKDGWRDEAFFSPAGAGWGKCAACLRTMRHLQDLDDQGICDDCAHDVSEGTRLSRLPSRHGEDDFIHYFPKAPSGEPAPFEHLVTHAAGKQWLGHLRIDADHIGAAFQALEGDPNRIWGLSRFLHTFFCQRVQELIETAYPLIYPVYGGGDDLYVIGPWNHVLELAVRLHVEFSDMTGNQMTFSAGLALGKPHQHILTKSDEAEAALKLAKDTGRNRVCALGSVHEWGEFRKILQRAGDVLRWRRQGQIPALLQGGESRDSHSTALPNAFLQDILQLSQAGGNVRRGRWKPLLNHQIARNVKNPDPYCRQWLDKLLEGGDEWRRAPIVVRYVLLSTQQPKAEMEATNAP